MWTTLLTKGLSFLSGWGGYAVLALGVAAASGMTTYRITEQIYNGRIQTIERNYSDARARANEEFARERLNLETKLSEVQGNLAREIEENATISTNLLEGTLNHASPADTRTLGIATLAYLAGLRNNQR